MNLLEKAFAEGEIAYTDEKGIADNPYERGSLFSREWLRGFFKAAKEDQHGESGTLS